MDAPVTRRHRGLPYLRRHLFLLLFLSIPALGGMAQGIDQATNVKYLGGLGGSISDSVRVGRYIYVAQGAILRVLETAARGTPREVGRLVLDEVITSLADKGPVLFAATRSFWSLYGDVKRIDLADPVRPRLMESFYEEADNGKHIRVEIGGNLLFVYSPRLSGIYDISDPRHPVEKRMTRAERERAAQVLDTTVTQVSDVEVSKAVQAVPDFHETVALQVNGYLAYLLDWNAGLIVVDVAHSGQPCLIGQCKLPVLGRCLAVQGTLAVVGGCGRIVALDVATPAKPVIVGQYEINTIVNQVAFVGDMICAAGGPSERRLWRWGVEDFWNYKEEPPPGQNDWEAAMREVQNQKNMASGIWMLSLADPAYPHLVSQYPTEKPCLDILTEKRRAFISGDGIAILDYAKPEHPLTTAGIKGDELARATFREPDDWSRIETWNLVQDGERLGFLLDTDRAQALAVVSVTASSLETPENLAWYDNGLRWATRATVSAGVCYTLERTHNSQAEYQTLMIKKGKKALGWSSCLHGGADIAVQGNLIYVADGYGGLSILKYEPEAGAPRRGARKSGE